MPSRGGAHDLDRLLRLHQLIMRIHGRSGAAYLSLLSGSAASPVAFLSGWNLTYAKTVFDTTVVTDTAHQYVASLSDPSGDFTGFFDTATAQVYAAATDGLPRNLYLYPAAANPGQFFSGLVLPDYRIGGGMGDAVKLSVSWAAAGAITETGAGAGTPGGYTATYAAVY